MNPTTELLLVGAGGVLLGAVIAELLRRLAFLRSRSEREAIKEFKFSITRLDNCYDKTMKTAQEVDRLRARLQKLEEIETNWPREEDEEWKPWEEWDRSPVDSWRYEPNRKLSSYAERAVAERKRGKSLAEIAREMGDDA